jgi:NHLM bacteriocin system ABC transporter ATP-binding protein
MATSTLDCVSLFEAEGAEMVVGGNSPVLLGEPDAVYYVKSGRLEIFSVMVENGQPEGARHHFFTAVDGDALFGMDLDRYGEGQGFLAVGMVGTRLLKLSLARLREHLQLPGFAASLAPIVDRWVSGLSSGIARTIVPHPRADLQLDAGEDGELADGKRVRARKAVAWVSHVEGASLFIGMEDLMDLPPGALFPVTTSTWLQALGPLKLTSVDGARAIADDAGWSGLEAFYGALFRCEFFNTRLAAADELNRLREKAERDRRIRSNSLSALAAVMARQTSAFAEVPADDPLVAACMVVGKAMQIEIKAPPKPKEGEESTDRLDAIVRASRVRSRQITLKGEWWLEETWPMLAYVEPADGGQARPVAVLRHGRHFEIHDPVDRTRVRVTRSVAATLTGRAVSFYRPFPDRKLKPLDLARFGLQGATFDLLRPLLVGLAGGALAMFPPYFTGMLVDTVIPEAARNQLVQIAIVLAVVAVTTTSFEIVRNLSILRLETKMSAVVQPAMWDRLLALPIAFFRRFAAGDLAQRVGTIDAIRQVMSGATIQAVMTSLFSMFLLAQMFYYSWQLALLGTGLVLLSMSATMLAGYLKLMRHRDVMKIEGKISALVLQLLTGVSKLRVTGAEGRAFAEWAREFAQKKKLALRTGMIENWLATFNAMFPVMSGMLIFWVLLEYVLGAGSTMSAGHFIAFNAAFGTFLMQMLQLSNAAMSVLLIVPLYERAQPILEALPEVDTTKADPGELTGRIDVDHVSFRYIEDGPLILNDVSLQIAAGEYVAIVGPSGSGKSTLFRMLLGLDIPEAGAIYFDGKNLAQLDVAKTRRRMGTVMQTGKIRNGSIFDNIVGSAPLTMDDAWEAARMAGFDMDVKQMPMGMQTMLQQGGQTLSGGQRQRLMIARAIVTKPRILLFDEATSALDNRTQAIVSQSLQELQATRVAIAHRLSTIRGADRIYVLEGGRLAQAGTYDELASQPGLFAELIRRQVA